MTAASPYLTDDDELKSLKYFCASVSKEMRKMKGNVNSKQGLFHEGCASQDKAENADG